MALMKRACCMLSNVGMSKTFYGEAIKIVWDLINQSPTIIMFKIPHEVQSLYQLF